MPRRKLRDTAHEREVLSSKVNPTGAGEDAPVRDVLSPEFAHKSDSQALDTVLALQQIIRGQSSLLANIDKFGEELIHLRERMNKYDKAAEAWKKDQQGFLERIDERAESLRINDPDEKAIFKAKAVMNIQNQIAFIRADTATTDSQFKSFIENQPKESIISEGKIVTVNENGVIKSKLIPEVIRIRNLAWELPPGRAVEVPKIVADEHRIRQKTKAEQEERQKLLRVTGLEEGKESSQVAKEWQNISNKYNAPTEAMPYGED